MANKHMKRCSTSVIIEVKWNSLSQVQLFVTPWTLWQYMEFSRPEYWSGYPFPSPGDLPNRGIEPRSPAMQADFLLAEPPGKPKNTGADSLSLLQWIYPGRNRTGSPALQADSLPSELQKCQSKPQCGIISSWSEWPQSKSLQTMLERVWGKGNTVGGNAN